MEQLEKKLSLFKSYQFLGDDFVIIRGLNYKNIKLPIPIENSAFCVCTKGMVNLDINQKSFTVLPKDLVIMPEKSIVKMKGISDDFDGCFISFSEKFSHEVVSQNIPQLVNMIIYVSENLVIHLEDSNYQYILKYLDFIWQFMEQKETVFKREELKHMIIAMSFCLYGLVPLNIKGGHLNQTRQDEIVEQFLKDANSHFRKERKVGYYADLQCITPKYLSLVTKQITGKTVTNWIDGLVTLEAKAQLKTTTKTVQQIAMDLNFANQSFFGKFFKRNAGMGPIEYRCSV
ncbi:MAG: helix-turn-helix domain-containing protein [Bacteroidaceae bacterium]|nr:helix-turn-helix domain-containing protein [Bacteroidaceae bacterium]